MEILYITLGWLFGLLSPSIIRLISNFYEEIKIKRIIIEDLKDLKKRISLVPLSVYPKLKKLDKEKLEWIVKNSGNIKFVETLEKAKSNKDFKLENFISFYNTTESSKGNIYSYFKKANLFTLNSNTNQLALTDKKFTQKVLEINFFVKAVNEDIEHFRELLTLTFSSNISAENHEIIQKSLKDKSLHVANQMMKIVDRINNILEE